MKLSLASQTALAALLLSPFTTPSFADDSNRITEWVKYIGNILQDGTYTGSTKDNKGCIIVVNADKHRFEVSLKVYKGLDDHGKKHRHNKGLEFGFRDWNTKSDTSTIKGKPDIDKDQHRLSMTVERREEDTTFDDEPTGEYIHTIRTIEVETDNSRNVALISIKDEEKDQKLSCYNIHKIKVSENLDDLDD